MEKLDKHHAWQRKLGKKFFIAGIIFVIVVGGLILYFGGTPYFNPGYDRWHIGPDNMLNILLFEGVMLLAAFFGFFHQAMYFKIKSDNAIKALKKK